MDICGLVRLGRTRFHCHPCSLSWCRVRRSCGSLRFRCRTRRLLSITALAIPVVFILVRAETGGTNETCPHCMDALVVVFALDSSATALAQCSNRQPTARDRRLVCVRVHYERWTYNRIGSDRRDRRSLRRRLLFVTRLALPPTFVETHALSASRTRVTAPFFISAIAVLLTRAIEPSALQLTAVIGQRHRRDQGRDGRERRKESSLQHYLL
jgi:hypothetical protein